MTTAELQDYRPLRITTTLRDEGRVCVIAPTGELDACTADELYDALPDGERPQGIVLDLANLSFCSSAGIHVYERLCEHRRHGCAVALALGSGAARRTFRHAGCETGPGITTTRAQALDAVRAAAR